MWLAHHGIKGQRWGVRRFQNPDGSLTAAGQRRYSKDFDRMYNKAFGNGDRVNVKNSMNLKQSTKFAFIKEIMDTTDSISKDPEMQEKYKEYERLKNEALDKVTAKMQKKYDSPDSPGAKDDFFKTLSKDKSAKQSIALMKEIKTIKNKELEHRIRNVLGDMYDKPINSIANTNKVTYGKFAYNVSNETVNELLKYRHKWEDIGI